MADTPTNLVVGVCQVGTCTANHGRTEKEWDSCERHASKGKVRMKASDFKDISEEQRSYGVVLSLILSLNNTIRLIELSCRETDMRDNILADARKALDYGKEWAGIGAEEKNEKRTN